MFPIEPSLVYTNSEKINDQYYLFWKTEGEKVTFEIMARTTGELSGYYGCQAVNDNI